MAISGLGIKPQLKTIERVLTWTAPAIAIPGLRYTQDNHQQRKELFVRDASTYTIGAVIFFLFKFLAEKVMTYLHLVQDIDRRDFAAALIGLTANMLYAGIGAVKFSHAFSRYQARKTQPQKAPPVQFHPPLSQSAQASGLILSPLYLNGTHGPIPGQTWRSPRFPLDRRIQYLA